MHSTAVVNTAEFLRNFNDEGTLDELAARVREAHAAAQNIAANALAAIFAAGEALIAARPQVAEGRWQHWLSTHCFLSLSTAKLYIQITEHRTEIEAALEKDPCLSLRAARRLITKPKRPPKSSTKADDQQPSLIPAEGNTLDPLGWWSGASREQRQHFLERVGLTDVLAALPSGWRPCWRHGSPVICRHRSFLTSSRVGSSATASITRRCRCKRFESFSIHLFRSS